MSLRSRYGVATYPWHTPEDYLKAAGVGAMAGATMGATAAIPTGEVASLAIVPIGAGLGAATGLGGTFLTDAIPRVYNGILDTGDALFDAGKYIRDVYSYSPNRVEKLGEMYVGYTPYNNPDGRFGSMIRPNTLPNVTIYGYPNKLTSSELPLPSIVLKRKAKQARRATPTEGASAAPTESTNTVPTEGASAAPTSGSSPEPPEDKKKNRLKQTLDRVRNRSPFWKSYTNGYKNGTGLGNTGRVLRDWQTLATGIDAIYNIAGYAGEKLDSTIVNDANWFFTKNLSPAGFLVKMSTKPKPAST